MGSLRIASIIVVIIVLCFIAARVFFLIFFLIFVIRLFSEEDFAGRRSIAEVFVEVL